MFYFPNALVAFICSVNFMFLCSYCSTLGKLENRLGNISCQSEKDCVPNAYCIDSTYCICKNDFVQDSSTQSCLPKSKNINDICNIDIQCSSSFGIHAYCFKNASISVGECRCVKNAHFQDGLCYESVRLGGKCKSSDNCVSVSGVPTYCALSVCVCSANYHPSDNRLDCIPDIELGKECQRDEECVSDNSYCSKVCSCQTGYVKSADGKSCLLIAKHLREQCVEDVQCQKYLKNSFCDIKEKNCKCVPFTHELDQSCWISARLGEACSHPNQCVTPSRNRTLVSCRQGVCTCAEGFTRTDSECTKLKDVAADSSSLEKCLFLTVAAVLLSLPSD